MGRRPHGQLNDPKSSTTSPRKKPNSPSFVCFSNTRPAENPIFTTLPKT